MIHIIKDAADLYDMCYSTAALADHIYFDFESTSLDVYTMRVLLLAVKFNDDEYVIDLTCIPDWAEIVKPFFESTSCVKVAHNFVFDYKILYHHGIDARPGYCTMVTEQMLNAGLRGLSNSLQAVALRRLHEVMDKTIREEFIGQAEGTALSNDEYTYAAKDVHVLPAIKAQQIQEIAQERMEWVHRLEMELLPVTSQMEYAGIDVDLEKVDAATPVFEQKLKTVTQAMQDFYINAQLADRIVFRRDGYQAVKLSSPAQMLEMFRSVGIDVDSTSAEELKDWDSRWVMKKQSKRTSTRVSATNDADMFLADEDSGIGYNHPLLRYHATHILLEKTLSTYLYPIKSHINPITGKLHPNFHQCGAGATGRYSSSNINFQNIITKDRLDLIGLGDYDIRSMFVSGEGCKFIDADFSGIELVILAAMSGDETLIHQIQSGDVHSFVGSNLFGVPFDKKMAKVEPYSTYRGVAKTTTYAIMYGSTGANLYRKLALRLASVGFTMVREMGDEWIAKWMSMFPKTGALLESNAQKAVTRLYTESIMGRRRHWSRDMFTTRQAIYAAQREGKNAPIQSSSADLTKMSELIVSRELNPKEAWLVASIHDELIIRAKDEWVEKYVPIVKWAMEEAGRLLFPNLPRGMITAEPAVVTFYSK